MIVKGTKVNLPAPYNQKKVYEVQMVTGKLAAVIIGGFWKWFDVNNLTMTTKEN